MHVYKTCLSCRVPIQHTIIIIYIYKYIVSCCDHLHDLHVCCWSVLFPGPQYYKQTTPAEGLGMRPLQKQLVEFHTKLKYAYTVLS